MEFQKPNIVQSQIVFEYEVNPLIRRKVFDYEEQLKDYFRVPFVTIPVPDTFDNNVARFESASHNGHSTLSASPIRLNFSTNYSSDYQTKISEIKDYLNPRINALKDLINGEKLKYIGYVIEFAYNLPKEEINPIIKTYSGVFAVNNNTVDFNLTYSIPFQDKYFLTIACSKYTLDVVSVIKTQAENSQKVERSYGISVRLDINTKYHISLGMKFEESFFDEVFTTIFGIIERNRLQNFLNGEIV